MTVLDSSGSMAGNDGSGSTRIAAARKAVGTVADALPDGYPERCTRLVPGQYLDSIVPGEEQYYATDLDAVSTADFSATVVPQPGAAIDTLDMLRTRIVHGTDISCDATFAMFGQHEGATPLTSGVSRIPTQRGTGGCDKAGRY